MVYSPTKIIRLNIKYNIFYSLFLDYREFYFCLPQNFGKLTFIAVAIHIMTFYLCLMYRFYLSETRLRTAIGYTQEDEFFFFPFVSDYYPYLEYLQYPEDFGQVAWWLETFEKDFLYIMPFQFHSEAMDFCYIAEFPSYGNLFKPAYNFDCFLLPPESEDNGDLFFRKYFPRAIDWDFTEEVIESDGIWWFYTKYDFLEEENQPYIIPMKDNFCYGGAFAETLRVYLGNPWGIDDFVKHNKYAMDSEHIIPTKNMVILETVFYNAIGDSHLVFKKEEIDSNCFIKRLNYYFFK